MPDGVFRYLPGVHEERQPIQGERHLYPEHLLAFHGILMQGNVRQVETEQTQAQGGNQEDGTAQKSGQSQAGQEQPEGQDHFPPVEVTYGLKGGRESGLHQQVFVPFLIAPQFGQQASRVGGGRPDEAIQHRPVPQAPHAVCLILEIAVTLGGEQPGQGTEHQQRSGSAHDGHNQVNAHGQAPGGRVRRPPGSGRIRRTKQVHPLQCPRLARRRCPAP